MDRLRGLEGIAAKSYFGSFSELLVLRVPESLRMTKRTKHPPRERINSLLSCGYGMIYSLVERSLVAVGLEPAFGFYHQPRSAALPLVLDVMEIFGTLNYGLIHSFTPNGSADASTKTKRNVLAYVLWSLGLAGLALDEAIAFGGSVARA